MKEFFVCLMVGHLNIGLKVSITATLRSKAFKTNPSGKKSDKKISSIIFFKRMKKKLSKNSKNFSFKNQNLSVFLTFFLIFEKEDMKNSKKFWIFSRVWSCPDLSGAEMLTPCLSAALPLLVQFSVRSNGTKKKTVKTIKIFHFFFVS